MSKMYHKMTFVLLISAILLPTMPLAQSVWAQSEQRCGREVPANLRGTFWSIVAHRGVTTAALSVIKGDQVESINTTTATRTELPINFPFDQVPLRNGTALATLQQPANSDRRDDEKILSIFAQGGQVITLSEDQKPDSLHWWRLLPEREPDSFGIFGYNNEATAFIVEANWSPDGITVGQPQYLPFEFYPIEFYWAMLAISPNWEFVAYIQPTPTNQLEFFIYSLSENRYIWRTLYDNNAFASIFWTPDSSLIGVVSGMTPEAQDQLIGVDRNGESNLLADLSTVYGDGVVVRPLSGVVLSSNEVAFLLNSPQQGTQSFTTRLVLLDLEGQQIVDLCYSHPATLRILGTSGDNVILGNSTARQIVVISAQTGDYSYINLGEGMNPLSNTFEGGEAADTP